MFFSAAKSLREGALHSQPSDDLVTLARRVISADADEIFSVLASVDASFVAMGQLTASIANEVKQPLAAAAMYGKASLNWLARNTPEIEEAKTCAECSLKQIDRAVQIIERIHQLVKKTSPEKQRLDVNETIVEVIELVHSEILKNGVDVRTELADCPEC